MSHFHTSCSFGHHSHRLHLSVWAWLFFESRDVRTRSELLSSTSFHHNHGWVCSAVCIPHITQVTKLSHTFQSFTIPDIKTITSQCSISWLVMTLRASPIRQTLRQLGASYLCTHLLHLVHFTELSSTPLPQTSHRWEHAIYQYCAYNRLQIMVWIHQQGRPWSDRFIHEEIIKIRIRSHGPNLIRLAVWKTWWQNVRKSQFGWASCAALLVAACECHGPQSSS